MGFFQKIPSYLPDGRNNLLIRILPCQKFIEHHYKPNTWDILFLIFTWQVVKRRLFWPSFQRYISILVTIQCETALPTCRTYNGNEGEPVLCLSTPLPALKIWKIERRFMKRVVYHLLASNLARAWRDSQTFRTFSLMSYLQGWRAKSCGKWGELSSLTLIPPSLLWNLASKSKRAAKSRKTASPSSLFIDAGLSLEREDAKLSHTQGSRSLKRTGLCLCWFRLSTKCEQSRLVDLSLTGRGEHPLPALPKPWPPGLLD